MATTKPVLKAAALDKTVATATENLIKACTNADAAVNAKKSEEKKLTAQVKLHTRKKAALNKRNKTAAAKLKKDANAANKKVAATVTRELKTARSALDKVRANKSVVSTELSALRATAKRLTAYTKAINAVDKKLNKPVKKKAKKKAKK